MGLDVYYKNNVTYDAFFIVVGPTLTSHTFMLHTSMCNNKVAQHEYIIFPHYVEYNHHKNCITRI